MGTRCVGCKIQHIAESGKTTAVAQVLIRKDSCHSWFAGKTLDRIGVDRVKNLEFAVGVNGKIVTRSVRYVVIESGNFKTIDEVVFAEPGDALQLGFRTLNGFNAIFDADKNELVAAGPVLAA